MSDVKRFDIINGEYQEMIKYLRKEFETVNDREVSLVLGGNGFDLKLSFRATDQYLVKLHDVNIAEKNLHYTELSEPSILTYGRIHQALFCGPPPLSGVDKTHLRILIFITSEASRFYVISRNVNQLIKDKNDSYAMDFAEADFIIKNCEKAREIAGLPDGRFEPLNDAVVHIARTRKTNKYGSIPHMGRYLSQTDNLNNLLKPKRR